MTISSPKQQLDGFLDKFSPEVAGTAHKALAAMRKRLPGALELVYDNYNALAIAFSPTEKVGDIIFSIALYPRWVSLFFAAGTKLKDPQKLLKGSGKSIRHIVLVDGAATLKEPGVSSLMDQALALADPPLDPKQKNRIVIKSVSANQRPRRPAK